MDTYYPNKVPDSLGPPAPAVSSSLLALAQYLDAGNGRFGMGVFQATTDGGSRSVGASRKIAEQTEAGDHVTDCPVMIQSGTKTFTDVDYSGAGEMPLRLVRNFDGARAVKKQSAFFGEGWTTEINMGLTVYRQDTFTHETSHSFVVNGIETRVNDKGSYSNGCDAVGYSPRPHTIVLRHNGAQRRFEESSEEAGVFLEPGEHDKYHRIEYQRDPNAPGNMYWWYFSPDDHRYKCSYNGRLLSKININSIAWTFEYNHVREAYSFFGKLETFNTTHLSRILHSNGDALEFEWDYAKNNGYGSISSVKLPNGSVIGYTIDDEDDLTDVIFPDDTGHCEYVYSANHQIRSRLIDGQQYGDYEYYAGGTVKSSGLVNGVNQSVFARTGSSTTVTNAKGGKKTSHYDDKKRLVAVDRDASDTCPSAAKSINYSNDENISRIEFKED